mmetsp:Transcript_38565/g.116576  ORF Transcript_38565/g.116576 Transcript_38565/m.116576 type:complete len:122 (-) Transcript_38565:15-380(-)
MGLARPLAALLVAAAAIACAASQECPATEDAEDACLLQVGAHRGPCMFCKSMFECGEPMSCEDGCCESIGRAEGKDEVDAQVARAAPARLAAWGSSSARRGGSASSTHTHSFTGCCLIPPR